MSKLVVGVCLLIISVIIFCMGWFIWFVSLGVPISGGGSPSPDETGILTGIVFMVGSIIVFLIGLVKAIKGMFGKK